jgi:hypothetical protein
MREDAHNTVDNEWHNVENAARILGVSKQAVRQRIYRNTIPHTKDTNGTVYVRVTPPNVEDHGESNDVDNTVLLDYVATLKDRIKHLEEESSRKDHIIMSLTQRIPELEAPSGPQRSPETASEEPYGTSPQEAEDSLQPRKRSWWREFLGME